MVSGKNSERLYRIFYGLMGDVPAIWTSIRGGGIVFWCVECHHGTPLPMPMRAAALAKWVEEAMSWNGATGVEVTMDHGDRLKIYFNFD